MNNKKVKLTKEQSEKVFLCGRCIKYLIDINRIDILDEFLQLVENIEKERKDVKKYG